MVQLELAPAAGSGAGGSAGCSVPEEERTGAGKNPRRKSATPSTSIATQHAAKVPAPSRMAPAPGGGPRLLAAGRSPRAAASGSGERPPSKREPADPTGAASPGRVSAAHRKYARKGRGSEASRLYFRREPRPRPPHVKVLTVLTGVSQVRNVAPFRLLGFRRRWCEGDVLSALETSKPVG